MNTLKNGEKVKILVGTYEGSIATVIVPPHKTGDEQIVTLDLAGDVVDFPRMYVQRIRDSESSIRCVA